MPTLLEDYTGQNLTGTVLKYRYSTCNCRGSNTYGRNHSPAAEIRKKKQEPVAQAGNGVGNCRSGDIGVDVLVFSVFLCLLNGRISLRVDERFVSPYPANPAAHFEPPSSPHAGF